MKQSEYTLQRVVREIEHALQGMNDADQAWLLAHIRAYCWSRMMRLNEHERLRAELDATSPLKLLRDSLRQKQT